MNCLHRVTYGCTVMTHAAGQQSRESRAIESCAQIAAAIRFFAGRGRQDGSRLRGIHAASLSIPSTSRTSEERCSCHGRQDCVYGQTICRPGATFEVLRQRKGLVAGRHCRPRSGGFSSAEGKAWVIGHEVGIPRFNWNIDLIVCYRQDWNRSTRCCCRIGDGLLDAQSHK
jgi:hypothetical protein